jgi:hypothetical protein
MAGIHDLLQTAQLPDLGPAKRPGTQSVTELDRALGPGASPLARATVLLWHDHLDEAHVIVQDVDTADGSYLHAIMHRREPDYGNAKYWFRRVGQHPCFKPLADEARQTLAGETALLGRLAPRGEWDPLAFVDACEQAAKAKLTRDQSELLRQIQAVEFRVLLERFNEREKNYAT